MVTRLTPQDTAFYSLESGPTPMHVGMLAIFEQPPAGVEYEEVLTVVEARLGAAPRYRQKVREVAAGLARPVWIDDSDFDITYHVRRSALPAPGSDAQLMDLIARLMSRPLDVKRPLWEMNLVEGLSDNRFALFVKSHLSLVDGTTAPEISHVIFDAEEHARPDPEELWMPARPPSDAALLIGAVGDLVTSPGEGIARATATFNEVTTSLTRAVSALGKLADVVRTATQVAPSNPLNATISRHRRLAAAKTPLEDYRRIRERYGCEINDVILTVIAGAMRNWLLSRGEPVTEASIVRAVVPMAVHRDATEGVGGDGHTEESRQVSSFLIDLPVGEPNPVVRLSHVAHATEAFARPGRRVPAQELARLSGFAPATLHAVSARVASGVSARTCNLMITNAPGPQYPLYVGGARMLDMYPVTPLLKNQTLSIALTSYDGYVYYGLNADRDAMSDVDVVRSLIFEALEELGDAGR